MHVHVIMHVHTLLTLLHNHHNTYALMHDHIFMHVHVDIHTHIKP